MNEIECPYCKCPNAVELDRDYVADSNELHHKCRHCQKNFSFIIEIILAIHPKQADCLNGSPHQFTEWEWLLTTPLYEGRKCSDCGWGEARIKKITTYEKQQKRQSIA